MENFNERTLILIKPDGVNRGLVGKITKRFEQKGFILVGQKLMRAQAKLIRAHYGFLKDEPFFESLIKYMTSGPVVPMVWEGPNVIKEGRSLLGATNPAFCAIGTIRGDFCVQTSIIDNHHSRTNIIHGSDSVKSANEEIELWFKPDELVEYEYTSHRWVYE